MAIGEGFFTGAIESNGDIVVVSGARDSRKVGIDLRREEELIQDIKERDELLDNWRGILIENGLLKLPKTAEEIAQEAAAEQLQLMHEQAEQQAEINQALMESNKALMEAVKGLSNTVRELKTREHDGSGSQVVDRPSDRKSGRNSKSNGKKPAANKISTGAGAKDTP